MERQLIGETIKVEISRAIEILEHGCKARPETYEQVSETCRMAIGALKKRIAEDPVKDKYGHNCCPDCGRIVSGDTGYGRLYSLYCENCGKAIRWET